MLDLMGTIRILYLYRQQRVAHALTVVLRQTITQLLNLKSRQSV